MNSISPKLSVVMSVKNNFKNYLELSVQSILDQTFNDFEFIIIVKLITEHTNVGTLYV